jgi:hypothetical protein
MAVGDDVIKTLKEWLNANPGESSLPTAFVEKMLETNARIYEGIGRKHEREELVCRLLASGMPVDEVSLILKIRKEEISEIEQGNIRGRIPEYAKKLQARRRNRQRAAGGPG